MNRRNSPKSQMSLNCFWQPLCTALYISELMKRLSLKNYWTFCFNSSILWFLDYSYLWHQQHRKSTIPGPSPQASSHTSHSEFRGRFPAIQWCKNFLLPWPRSCEWLDDRRLIWLAIVSALFISTVIQK